MIRILALAGPTLLAACGADRTPEAPPEAAAVRAVPRTLIPADLDPKANGPRVDGTEISEVAVGSAKTPLARYHAFVLCAEKVTACDPERLPAGTVYTYIVTITPLVPAPHGPPSQGVPSADEGASDSLEQPLAPAELVQTIGPVPQFKGVVGFAMEQATAALGSAEALSVTLDQNRLVWRVTRGTWQPGKPITLWFRSASPPAQSAPAYRLEYGGRSAAIAAPFPAADKPVEPRSAR